MANEAVLVEDSGLNPTMRTVSDTFLISKGTILKLTDPNTVVQSSGAADEFGGIAASEKVAADGSSTLGAHMNGVFDCKLAAGATCSVGEQLAISEANLLDAATEAEVQLGQWVGYALEAGGVSETILVQLRGG